MESDYIIPRKKSTHISIWRGNNENQLKKTLKKLKMGMFNEKHSKEPTLQCDKVLTKLKTIDSHASS